MMFKNFMSRQALLQGAPMQTIVSYVGTFFFYFFFLKFGDVYLPPRSSYANNSVLCK